jgi:hypothetical protein
MKMKTIVLSIKDAVDGRANGRQYRVEKVTDSVQYSPRDILTKSEVENLCNNQHWKVTILMINENDA